MHSFPSYPEYMTEEPEAVSEAFINRLPNEVLSDIFELSPSTNKRWPWLGIMLVCPRWRGIGQRLLYRRLNLNISNLPPRLLDLWMRNSHLKRHVRDLNLVSYATENFDEQWTLDMVKSLSLKGELTINGRLGQGARPLLEHFRTLPLTAVHLNGFPSLNMVFEFFAMPTLHTLSLTEWGWSRNGEFQIRRTGLNPVLLRIDEDWVVESEWDEGSVSAAIDDSPASSKELDLLLPPDRLRTATFTTLNLHTPGTDVKVTERLVQWPARLTELNLTGLSKSRFAMDYTTEELEDLLAIHMDTLQKLHIGTTVYWLCFPDVSNFPRLEELRVVSGDMFYEEPEDLLPDLAAPRLRHLIIDLDPLNQLSELQNDGMCHERRWMRKFFKGVRQSRRLASLREITFMYNPNRLHLSRSSFSGRGVRQWSDIFPDLEEDAREWQIKFNYLRKE